MIMVIGEGKRIMVAYKEHDVYKDQELTNFFEALEAKYSLLNYSDRYGKLVNFSKNEDVPFHQWFRYREGFAGELIEQLIIDSGINETGIIIDPFAGSGTTPVVAKQMGYDAFAIDVNPISSFITNIKLYEYSDAELRVIQTEIDKYLASIPESLESCSFEINSIESVEKYFTKNNYSEIIQIKKYISLIENNLVKDFFKCALLCIVEDISDRKRDGNGLKRYDSKITDVKSEYINKISEMLEDVINQQKSNDKIGISVLGSAENLNSLYKKSFEGKHDKATIIFSPPYPNSFDYFESYKLELVIGDFAEDISDIKKFRKKAVRSFIGVEKQETFNQYISLLATEISDRIPLKEAETRKKDNRTRKVPNMIMGYFYDMAKVISECYELLNEGGKVYIVVDQSSYLGVIVPTDLLFGYFAELSGFKVEEIIECRKARTSPQQLSKYPYLKHMLRESIVVLEKKQTVF